MNAFAPGVAERIGHYVYLLIDPADRTVFYVGTGSGDRCFAHLDEARLTPPDSSDDCQKLARIQRIEAAGMAVEIAILRHGLCDEQARLVEATTIDLLDVLTNERAGAHTVTHGRMSVAHLNAHYGARPVTIDPDHRVALIRISQGYDRAMSAEQIYEATRKWWRVAVRRCVPGAPGAPDWAFAVSGGIVRAVYRIESWRQATADEVRADPGARGRWAFTGTCDHELEARYRFGDVSNYLRGQSPVRYVHCDGEQEFAMHASTRRATALSREAVSTD